MDTPRAADNPFWCVLLARCVTVVRGCAIHTALGSAMFLAQKSRAARTLPRSVSGRGERAVSLNLTPNGGRRI